MVIQLEKIPEGTAVIKDEAPESGMTLSHEKYPLILHGNSLPSLMFVSDNQFSMSTLAHLPTPAHDTPSEGLLMTMVWSKGKC